MLAMLGWNPGSEQEIFSLSELCETFSMERVHKGGAKFDYEKAKWFNHQHMLRADNDRLARLALPYFEKEDVHPDHQQLGVVIGFIKERCHLLPDLVQQGLFFFKAPEQIDLDAILPKWNEGKVQFFESWIKSFDFEAQSAEAWEQSFADLVAAKQVKKGDVMLPLRVMLVGGKFGPGIFDIAAFIGKAEVQKRIQFALGRIKATAGSIS
jgi:glutamyl-tRNA synthetase